MFLENISNSNKTTMSSREIAQLCEKRHDHVLRDIRAYVGAVIKMERGIDVKSMDWGNEEGVHFFGETPIKGVTLKHEINHQNKQYYPVCYLDKNTTLTIISGYNVLLRKRIIERWSELEAQVRAPAVPQSLPEALRLAADLAEKLEEQQAQLAIATPKAAALDLIGAAEGSLGVRETAKTLDIAQNKFTAWCVNNGWMYRDSKYKLQPYSGRIQQGYMEQRPVTFNGRDGTTRATTQPMFTPKGLTRLAQIFAIVHEVA